jgi:hypothetical protein
MGFCYLLQYMDKLALSTSTLLGLLKDLVRKRQHSRLVARTDADPLLPGTPRRPIFLVLSRLLFWISRMELAKLLPHCPLSHREIPRRYCVREPFSPPLTRLSILCPQVTDKKAIADVNRCIGFSGAAFSCVTVQ